MNQEFVKELKNESILVCNMRIKKSENRIDSCKFEIESCRFEIDAEEMIINFWKERLNIIKGDKD